jgi:hypothetical protein
MFHQKEDAMRVRYLFTVGFLSMIAAGAGLSASERIAAGAQRVDVIESLNGMVAQQDSMRPRDPSKRVDVIEAIGSKGPAYSYTKSMRVDVIESIASEGPKHS